MTEHIDDDLQSYFDGLMNDLNEEKDRSDELDELFQWTFLGDAEAKRKASWCVAKMAQNGIQDQRIIDILVPLTECIDPDTRYNVAWGIGEMARIGIGDDRCVNIIMELMCDPDSKVRAKAFWAATMLRDVLGIRDSSLSDRIDSSDIQ